MAIALGLPIVRYDFFVLFRAHNRYTLQFQVGSIRFEENGHIGPTLVIGKFSTLPADDGLRYKQ